MAIAKSQRQAAIADMAARNGEVAVDRLASQFAVCPMTIRRDLAEMSASGRLSRVHGGATPSRVGVVEFAFRERSDLRAIQKKAIARIAASRVRTGMAVSLDTGTTTLEVARAMAGIPNITVLTTSLAIASVLYSSTDIELVILGGSVSRARPELLGPLTEENLRRFRVHVAFLGADAITPAGVFTTDVRVARICRAMMDNAREVLVVADSSKFQETAFVQYAPLADVHCIVTDGDCPASVRRWLEAEVKEVIYAEADRN